MALIARLQHPFVIEFKEAWVEKVIALKLPCWIYSGLVRHLVSFNSSLLKPILPTADAGLFCLHSY